MMRRVYRLERVGIPPLPQAIPGRQKAPKQKAKLPPSQPTLPLLSADSRPVGKRHLVDGLVPVNIDQSGTIRRASTGRTLWIAPGSPTDRANPGAADGSTLLTNPHCTRWWQTTAKVLKPPPDHFQ